MRRILYIVLLLIVSMVCRAQYITISGYVTDAETGLALKDINIKPDCISSGAVTNNLGFFSLKVEQRNCNITFSHIAYYNYVFEYKGSKNNKELNIKLKPKTHLLDKITISSDKIINITKELPVYVKDYVIINNKILLLTYYHKKSNDARLMLIDQSGNNLAEKPVYKPSKLFKDCFEEIYLITDNNASKLEIKPREIQYKEDVPIKEFNQTYGGFDFAINNKIYFSTYHYQYFVIKFHYFDLDAESNKVNNFVTLRDEKKISEFERDFNFFYYAKRASRYGMSVTSVYNNLDMLRANQQLDWEDFKCRFSPMIAPFNNVNDTICIFNTAVDSLELYSESGKIIKKVAAPFLADKDYKSIIRDQEAKKLYVLYKCNNIYSLSLVNINTGTTKAKISIPNYPFIENIKVSKDEIFFLYKKNINEEYKQLYKMPLE